jgi:cation diffusion facilitator CzcD-associated flavoprotein CzcO
MASTGEGDGYRGPAQLRLGDATFDVVADLRGRFEPIDGRYHWYGRLARHDGLTAVLAQPMPAGASPSNPPQGRGTGVLTTSAGSAVCKLSDPDPWDRYRVTGTARPPFATGISRGALVQPKGAGQAAGDAQADVGTVKAGGYALADHDAVPAGRDALPDHVTVAVIGAGFGGIGVGIRLREAGMTDFVILERASAVGGTWRDNTYPGCACDVPSHLYSYSFALNPGWSRSFSGQQEIWRYLEDVADRYRVRGHIRFGAEVMQARWDRAAALWRLETVLGVLTADVMVVAAGPLSEPSYPDIPGLDSFTGEVFHSARWNHDASLAGKRVAVVGTGASAIQIVPEIQQAAASLVLFQRTPAWILPRRDKPISPARRRLYGRVPATQKAVRLGQYLSREALVGGFVRRPGMLRAAQRIALAHMARSVSDPDLRAKLTPDYVMGCKRILLSDDFYPSLAQANVQVVAAGLAKVDGATLTAQDGTACEADAIIFATGFRVTDMPMAERILGAGGVSLADCWHGDMSALRGTTVAGYPNMCLVIGPNTGLGHNSMIYIIESQLSYIHSYVTAVAGLGGRGALDVKAGAQQRWNAAVQRRMARSVWVTGGCQSWYLSAPGRSPAIWPGSTLAFRRATRRLDLAEYEIIAAGGVP